MAVSRELTIVYGSTTIDGSGGIHLHGDPPIRWVRRWDGGQLDFTVVITAASAAALITAVEAFVGAMRTPRADLLVKRGGSNELDLRPSTNSAFDTQGEAAKVGDPWDSGRSQLVAVSIKFGLPADKASLAGRREAFVTVQFDASTRRRVTIEGVYTAISSNSALAQYTAEISAFATAVLTTVGGAHELVDHYQRYFETIKELKFRREYLEILQGQLSDTAATDDADIADQNMAIVVRTVGPGDTQQPDNVMRLAVAEVSYSCAVPGGPDELDDVADRIAAFLADRVAAAIPAIGYALVEHSPRKLYDESRIEVTQRWECALQGGWAEYQREESLDLDTGTVLVPMWSATEYKRYRYQSPKKLTCSVKEVGLWVGSADRNAAVQLRQTNPTIAPPPGAQWVLLGVSSSPTDVRRGINGHTLDTMRIMRQCRFEAAVIAQSPAITPG